MIGFIKSMIEEFDEIVTKASRMQFVSIILAVVVAVILVAVGAVMAMMGVVLLVLKTMIRDVAPINDSYHA